MYLIAQQTLTMEGSDAGSFILKRIFTFYRKFKTGNVTKSWTQVFRVSLFFCSEASFKDIILCKI